MDLDRDDTRQFYERRLMEARRRLAAARAALDPPDPQALGFLQRDVDYFEGQLERVEEIKG